MNKAQELLIRIGGAAALVAGRAGYWWADKQTEKRARTRGRTGPGIYGISLRAYFDRKRQEAKERKQ